MVHRAILLKKFYNYEARGDEWKWFKSYLINRKQILKFNNKLSNPVKSEMGVPQGSICGPLLFLLHINDIKIVRKYCQIKLFADDGLIYVEENELCDSMIKLMDDVNSIKRYLDINQLKSNLAKLK